MSRYLVTGGAGFIGSNIVDHLVGAGEDVRVIENFATGRRENIEAFLDAIDFIEGDITNPEDCARAVEGVDYVLHQAAVPSVPASVKDPFRSHNANVTGTLNLLIAARDAGVKRFVYAGSSSAYGDQPVEFKEEDLPTCPLSPYAASKLSGEFYAQVFARCYAMETVILRYFNVFGPRQNPDSTYSAVVPLFIKAALRGGRPTIYGDGQQARDFTYVENNVRANILAATSPNAQAGAVYNIACGRSYSLLHLWEAVKEITGAVGEPLFAEARVGDVRDSKARIARAQRDLAYDVTVPFEEGLRKTVHWYRGNL